MGLLRLTEYLKKMVESDCESTREYILANPYKQFPQRVRPDTGSDNSEGDEHANADGEHASADDDYENRCKPTPPFEIGSVIDAFWPDEETWLLATVKELVNEKLKIVWHEDGSESLVPLGYVRVHTAGKATLSAWCRMSSRSKEGQYYYYNNVTLETQLEPPPPWQLCRSRRNPDVMYYWHRLSGRTSLEKPEILEGE